MSENYASLLDKPADDIKRPDPWPIGTYLCRVDPLIVDMTKPKDTSKQPTQIVRVPLCPLQPQEDVDPDALTAGNFSEKLGRAAFRQDFFITEDAAYRFRNFLVDILGISSAGKSTRQMMGEAAGKLVYAKIAHAPSTQDPEVMWVNVTELAPYTE